MLEWTPMGNQGSLLYFCMDVKTSSLLTYVFNLFNPRALADGAVAGLASP